MLGQRLITWDQRTRERGDLKDASDSIKIHVGSEHRGRDQGAVGQEGDPSHLRIDLPRGMGRSIQQINLIDIELPNTSYNISEHNNRIHFNEYEAVTTLTMQEPYAVNGYYPVYSTAENAGAHEGATGSSTQEFADYGLTLHVPTGVTVESGTYTGSGVTYDASLDFKCSRFYAVVPPGTYTGTQLAGAVERAMNKSWVKVDGSTETSGSPYEAPQNTYKVNLDTATGRLVVSAGAFTGDFGESTFAQTAGPTVPFAVRGLSDPDSEVVVVSAQVNPLGADIANGAVEANGLQNRVQDSPLRLKLHLSNAEHALIPGDPVRVSNLMQTTSMNGRVILVDRAEVHVLVGLVPTAGFEPARLVRTGAQIGSCMGPVLGLDPRRGQRQGLVSTLRTNFDHEPTVNLFSIRVFVNAVGGGQKGGDLLLKLVSSGLDGDLPALSPSATSTTLTLFEPHQLADGSSVGIDASTTLEVASVEGTDSGDRVPNVELTAAQEVAMGSRVFETSSTATEHGSPNVRGVSKMDLTRLGRCIFVALETPAQGRLGSIYVPGSGDPRPFFARVQLDADRDALEMNHDSAVGIHTFAQPADVSEVVLRVYDETGTRPLDTGGVFTSLLLELVPLCNQ